MWNYPFMLFVRVANTAPPHTLQLNIVFLIGNIAVLWLSDDDLSGNEAFHGHFQIQCSDDFGIFLI